MVGHELRRDQLVVQMVCDQSRYGGIGRRLSRTLAVIDALGSQDPSRGSPHCRTSIDKGTIVYRKNVSGRAVGFRNVTKDFAPSCFHCASTGFANANAAPEGGA